MKIEYPFVDDAIKTAMMTMTTMLIWGARTNAEKSFFHYLFICMFVIFICIFDVSMDKCVRI